MKTQSWDKKSFRGLETIIILSAILLVIAGFLFINREEKLWEEQARNMLKRHSNTLVQQLEEWQSETIHYCEAYASNKIIQKTIWAELTNYRDTLLRNKIQQSLKNEIVNLKDLYNILVCDSSGSPIFYGNTTHAEDLNNRKLYNNKGFQAIKNPNLYFNKSENDSIVLNLEFPIIDEKTQKKANLLFQINPYVELFPLLKPETAHTTEESFLFTAAGDSLLYISPLKHDPDAVLSFKVALSDKNNPAAKAILNGTAFYEGRGYHHQKVMEYIQPLKNTSLYLAVKIDKDEFMQPVYAHLKKLVTLISVIFLLFISGVLILVNYRKKHYYKQLLIDEQKEAALRKHYEYILKYANDILLLEDLDLNIIDANERALETYQYTFDEICKLKKTDLIIPELRAEAVERLKHINQQGSYVVESIHQRKDGSQFNVEISARLIKIDGKIFLHQIIRDITERKIAEARLREKEERFRTTLNSSGDGIITTDTDANIVNMNPVAEKLTGWTEAEARGKNIEEVFAIFNELTRKKLECPVTKVLKHETIVLLADHTVLKNKNGLEIPVNDSGAPIRNQKGEITGVVLVFRDYTDERLAQKKLEESERLFHNLTNSAPVGIFRTRPDGYTNYVNPFWCKLSGLTPEQAFGNGWLEALMPEDKERVMKGWQNAVNDAIPSHDEYRFLHHDGTVVHVSGNTVKEIDSDNKVIGYIGTITDITELKRYQKEQELLREKAEESDRLKSAFLANMSHEIRTPMNGILGFTELLLEPDLTSEEKENYIKIVHQSGQRMLNTVNDIVEISKIEAGMVQIVQKETDVNESIAELVRFFKPEAEKKGLQLLVDELLPEPEKIVTTDTNKLNSILTNLIKNAIKYTDSGTINLGCQMKDSEIEFYVKDTGIGIPADRVDAVFNRFEQADIEDTRVFEGSGLGLAISKSYVEMLGGKIWVESEEGKGSTFYFTLPVKEKNSEILSKPIETSSEKKIQPGFKKLKILIAEDDETSLNYISLIIKDFCPEPLKAGTGIEAVELCRNHKDIDLILMDIRMPEMNGYEATRRIRAFNKEVVIIAQTAFALSGDREKAIEAGCNDYISKPVKRVELQKLIEKYFGE